MMSIKFPYLVSAEYRICEDNYLEGENEVETVWTDKCSGLTSAIEALKCLAYVGLDNRSIEEIFENDPCNEGDFGRYDGDIFVKFDQNEIASAPTDEDIEEWKNGRIKLYNVHIIANVCKMSTCTVDDVPACFKNDK